MSSYCSYCKHIILNKNDDYIHEKRHYHPKCLVLYLKESEDKFTQEQAEELVNEIKNAKLLKSKTTLLKKYTATKEENRNSGVECSKILSYIMDRYNIVVIPQFVRKTIRSICDGTYSKKGERILFEPIDEDTLISMFKYFSPQLLQAHHYRESRGNGFQSEDLKIVYDLAILVSHYNDYRLILNQRKSYDKVKEESKASENIIIETQKIKNCETLTGDDLSSLSDSIWD